MLLASILNKTRGLIELREREREKKKKKRRERGVSHYLTPNLDGAI